MTLCTADPIVDAGLGVRFEVRRMNGVIAHVFYWHPNPKDGSECQGCVSVKPAWDDGWDLVR